jgi:cobalt/nickel transport protein
MRVLGIGVATALAAAAAAGTAAAHYHVLLADPPSARAGEAVTLTLRFGHPFEHQFVSAERPRRVVVLDPDGRTTDLLPKLELVSTPAGEGEPIQSYRLRYVPAVRGDYVFAVECDPVWLPGEEVYVHDTAKVLVHVQTQSAWDAAAGVRMELLPLTRPYGLRAGTAFQAQAFGPSGDGQNGRGINGLTPLPLTLVEVERYNPAPPKDPPPDEYVTRTVKTDPNGVATATLHDPGWWTLTAVRDAGTRDRGGRTYPVKQRATLWVFVDGGVPPAPAK